MTETRTNDNDAEPTIDEDELAYAAEHLPELRAYVAGKRILYWWMGIALVLGLVAHIVGFLLGRGDPDTFVALVADLLKSLGIALWTGVFIVAFLEVIPEWQTRAGRRRIREYEAELARRRRRDPGSR